jgi:2,3-bisphosphoglycerate-independent phosphoglycerate mutase
MGQAFALKVGYVLLDGCGDRPDPTLNFTTPLEAASTPSLDKIARRSRMGRVITVGRGISPESDIAVFNMLGYSFSEGYAGRGLVEAVGAGLRFEDGDLALRANFATIERGIITDRRAGRDITRDEAAGLQGDLEGIKLTDAEFEFRSTISHRGVVVIRADRPLSAEISNTDPAYVRVRGFGAAKPIAGNTRIEKCRALVASASARRAAALVNEFTEKALKALADSTTNRERIVSGKKPANAVLLRDAGDHVPEVASFRERHGVKGVALVEMPAEVGIAKLLGMKRVVLEDQGDLAKKAEAFAREMGDDTVVYVHIKGPDEFGHDGDAPGKKRNIELIDREFFSRISLPTAGVRLAVSCDHATPCQLGMHSSDPVPLLITTESGTRDCCRFTERDAGRGSIGTIFGRDVLSRVLAKD